MAVFQIRLKQEYISEEMVNVFYYESNAGTPDSEDLLDVFLDEVWDYARAVQSDGCNSVEAYVINGTLNSDYEVRALGSTGALTGTSGNNLPAHLAVGFRGPSGGPGKRYSYKRIGGLRAGIFTGDGNGSFNETYRDILYPIQDALGSALEGANAAYSPVQITGGFKLGVVPTVDYSLNGDWSTDVYITTQKTRQPYLWTLIPPP